VDIVHFFDADGQVTRETMDLDYDGKVDDTLYFEKGKKVRSEKDLDGDGRVDTWGYYDGSEKLSRKERDVKGSGKVDYWEYWENGSSTGSARTSTRRPGGPLTKGGEPATAGKARHGRPGARTSPRAGPRRPAPACSPRARRSR
jgi:hypothetical protein